MIQLVNIQEMAKNYPDNFVAPNENELDAVKVGDSVKLCINNKEKLWVAVQAINNGNFKGKIDNHPIVIDDVSYGDSVMFKKENIYLIFN